MAKYTEALSQLWSLIARTLARLSLRYFLVIISLLLFILPMSLVLISPIDKSLLYLVAKLSGVQRGSAELAIITVPDDQVKLWSRDTYRSDGLSSLLSNVLYSSRAQVGLLLDEPIHSESNAIDLHIQKAENADTNSLSFIQKKAYLAELLADQRVTLGVFDLALSGVSELRKVDAQSFYGQIARVADWYEGCKYCVEQQAQQSYPEWYWQSTEPRALDHLWYKTDAERYPSFLMSYSSKLKDLQQDVVVSPPKWTQNWMVDVENQIYFPIQSYIPLRTVLDRFQARIIHLDIIEAQSVNAFPRYVFIGAERHREKMIDIANAFYSVKNREAFVSPWWIEGVVRIALLFSALYFCFLHVRIKRFVHKCTLLAVVIAALSGLVIYCAIQFHYWLSISSFIFYSAILAFVTSLWRANRQQEERKTKASNDAILDATQRLEKEANYYQAAALLAHHSERDRAIERICALSEKIVKKTMQSTEAVTLITSVMEVTGKDPRLLKLLNKFQRSATQQSATVILKSAPKAPIPKQLGRYEIQKELGRGAVGVVYLGFDPAISRQVAVKALDTRQFSREQVDNLTERFFREAEAAGRLNHPNIVSVYDVGEEGDRAFIAMDFVNGEALSQYTSEDTLLSVYTVYRIIHDVALALAYAHEHQIVHRDIKPGNIMYSDSPYTLKVADFGIARLLDNSKTSTGEILGSPLYMAPEQLQGSKVSATADIFSLGVTFYQLLTGNLPFNSDNLAGLTYEIIHTKHRNVRAVRKDLPASAARIINQCLQKKSSDRYESALELASVIRKAIKRDFPADAKRLGVL